MQTVNDLCYIEEYMRERKKKLKIALYKYQKEIHIAAARVAPGDLGLKSHAKDYKQKLTYLLGHPT